MPWTLAELAAQQVRAELHGARASQRERDAAFAAGALERGGVDLTERVPEQLSGSVLALVASDASRVVTSSSLLHAWSSRVVGGLSLLGDPAPGYSGGKAVFDGTDDFMKGPDGSSWEGSLLSTSMWGCICFETGLTVPSPAAGWPTAGGYAALVEAEEANIALYVDATGLRFGLSDTLGARYRTTGIELLPSATYVLEYELSGRVATLRLGLGGETFTERRVDLAAEFDASIGAGVWVGLGNGVAWPWTLSLWTHTRGSVPSAEELRAFRRWLLAQGFGCAAWSG